MEYDIGEISTATTTFSTMPDSMVTLETSPEVRCLPYFKMVDRGPEVQMFGGNLELRAEVGFEEG